MENLHPMRNLDLLPALKFYCTTKMEVVEEINRIRDDPLDFLETFEEHRKALLHVLKKHLCNNRGCTGRGLFTTDNRNLFWSERQHHLNGRQYGCSRGKHVRAPSKVLK